MINPEQTFAEELEKVDLHFTACRNSEETEKLPCFFKMAFQKSVDASRKFNGTSFFENFNYDDKESSLIEVRKGIQAFGSTGMPYIKISLLSSKTSNNSRVCVIRNPYYQGASSIGGIGGIGTGGLGQNSQFMYQQSQQNMLMTLQQQMHQQQMASQKEIAEIRHEQALKVQQDYIDYLEDDNKSAIAKIGELAQSPSMLPIAQAVAGFINKFTANQNVQPVQQVQPAQPLAQQQTDEQTHTEEQMEAGRRIQESLLKISTVFPDYVEKLEVMADYIKNNPDMAKTMFASQQQQ